MTDREAIRRLAEIVAHIADCIPTELALPDALALERALAEPAGPTAELNTARTDWPIVCRHGTSVSCSCEFGRGYEQARRDITSDSLKTIQHPTVTREQAELVVELLTESLSDAICTADLRHEHDAESFHERVRELLDHDKPAVVRAVADRLEDR